jgi:hypothetical protein
VKGLNIPWEIRERVHLTIKFQGQDIINHVMSKFMKRLLNGSFHKTQMVIMMVQQSTLIN